MKEVSEHLIYKLLQDRYDEVACDYVILSSDEEYRGMETHKKAVICAFEILNDRYSSYDLKIDVDKDKMAAERIGIDELLELPSDDYFTEKEKLREKRIMTRSYDIPSPLAYWFAFLEPPYGTPYQKSDFIDFNKALVLNRDDTEVYRWNDDFSNYFDAGKEWWGTGLWSIYDIKTGLFVIIGASLTD